MKEVSSIIQLKFSKTFIKRDISLVKRDKLTKNQKRQIKKTQQKATADKTALSRIGQLGQRRQGRMVSRFGEQADVLDKENGQIYRCFLRQNLGAPVTGDYVEFRLDPQNQGIVESIGERKSLLQRPSPHQGLKPVVANVDQAFVLVAPLPDFSSILLDRYLIAIENTGLDIILLANKWDLTEEIARQKIETQLELYADLGYPIIKCSTKESLGKNLLLDALKNHESILLGQSGVGKSSIINWLFPEQKLATQNVSDNSRLGQHTTTASQLFCLNPADINDGLVVDSPGIREFGLWHLQTHEIAAGFREFKPFLGACKYRDCKHTNEPACQILQGVKDNKISSQRWNNYLKILNNNQL